MSLEDENIEIIKNIVKGFVDEYLASNYNEITLLQEQVIKLQRILVQDRAYSAYLDIIQDNILRILKTDRPRTSKSLHIKLYATYNKLKGKLSEDAIPEDAYKDWLTETSAQLRSVFTPDQVTALIRKYYDWAELIGFQDVHLD
jgi:hypothetical protein